MPVYTYRREDGTTFDIQQKFLDEPLTTCPTTGQKVVRIIQAPGIIFKGSGFYVNDSKNASKSSISSPGNGHKSENGNGTSSEAKPETKPEAAKPEAKSESKTETKTAD